MYATWEERRWYQLVVCSVDTWYNWELLNSICQFPRQSRLCSSVTSFVSPCSHMSILHVCSMFMFFSWMLRTFGHNSRWMTVTCCVITTEKQYYGQTVLVNIMWFLFKAHLCADIGYYDRPFSNFSSNLYLIVIVSSVLLLKVIRIQ